MIIMVMMTLHHNQLTCNYFIRLSVVLVAELPNDERLSLLLLLAMLCLCICFTVFGLLSTAAAAAAEVIAMAAALLLLLLLRLVLLHEAEEVFFVDEARRCLCGSRPCVMTF